MNYRLLSVVSLSLVFVVALLAVGGGVALTASAQSDVSPTGTVQINAPLSTTFTYQGQLKYHNTPAHGLFDFEFRLYDAVTGGAQVGSVVAQQDISVTNGLFTVVLDFGASAFTGQARWLEIFVRPGAETGAFTLLSPRQALTAVPYALHAASTGALHGYAVTSTAPLEGQALVWSNGAWNPRTTSGITVGVGLTLNQGLISLLSAFQLPQACTNGQVSKWNGSAWACAADNGTTNHGSLSGLTADDHPQYFNLNQNEVVTGTPAFNGGTSGSTPPFSVDSTTLVTNLNADRLDGQHASAFQQHYANLIVVAKSGGDYTSLTAALGSITTAGDANRYLIKVMPGVYTETVIMKPYVDIEGAGELTTRLTSMGSGSQLTGTVIGANNAELRFLTVANTGGNTRATAIYNDAASPRLTHVTASASGGTGENFGVHNNNSSSPQMTNVTASASGGGASYGVYNYYSSPQMTNVTASASGGNYTTGVSNGFSSPQMTNVTASASGGAGSNTGVSNSYSSPQMTNVTASASGGTNAYGVYNSDSSATIDNSTIRASGASSFGLYITNPASGTVTVNNSQVAGGTRTIYKDGGTTQVGATLLKGGAVAGAITCAGVYDENYTFYASTCP